MKIALVAALALAVTAAQAQQTQERDYGQQKRAGEQAHGQKELKVSNPSEWQFHKVEEKHKGVEASGNVQCAEPFGMMKGGLTAKVAKFDAGSRFKATAKEDMFIHVHEGSLSISKAEATGGQAQPGQERRFGQEQQPQQRQPGQSQMEGQTARSGALIHIPAGTTCWVSSEGQTTAVVFTKAGEGQTGEMESPEPKSDVK